MFDVLAWIFIGVIFTALSPLWVVLVVLYVWFLISVEIKAKITNWIGANFP